MGRNPILLSFASTKAMRTSLRLSALSVADALVRPPPPPDGRCYPLHRRQGLWHTSGQLTCVRTCAAGGLFKKGGSGSGLGRRTARVGSDGVSMAYAARSRSCALRQSRLAVSMVSMGRLKADPNRHQPRRRRGCLLSPCLPACLPVPACLPSCLPVCPTESVCVRLQFADTGLHMCGLICCLRVCVVCVCHGDV